MGWALAWEDILNSFAETTSDLTEAYGDRDLAEAERLTFQMVGLFAEATLIEPPSNPEVRVIHDMLLESFELGAGGSLDMLIGIQNLDEDTVNAGTEKVVEASVLLNEATALLDEFTSSFDWALR
jgi:hypothetical protein